jgi:mannitol/fructose-specific phosphotransferase system IIA component (Ntr-type)
MFSFHSTSKSSGNPCSGCAESHWYPQHLYEDLPFLLPHAEISQLVGTTREEVFDELLQSLVSASVIGAENKSKVLEELMHRETLSSTGVGHGVAVPHLRVPFVENPTGLIARSVRGVEYDSQDGGLVHVFILLFTNPKEHTAHLHGLEKITRHLRKALALSVGL